MYLSCISVYHTRLCLLFYAIIIIRELRRQTGTTLALSSVWGTPKFFFRQFLRLCLDNCLVGHFCLTFPSRLRPCSFTFSLPASSLSFHRSDPNHLLNVNTNQRSLSFISTLEHTMNPSSQDEEQPYSSMELTYRDSSTESAERRGLPFPDNKSSWGLNKSRRKSRGLNLVLYSTLYILANICYLLALWPAPTPRIMNRRLGKIGALIVLSVLLFSAQLWLAFVKRATLRGWVCSCLLQITTVATWYIYDSGNVLASHGAYNLLVFLLIFIPANFLVAVIYFWYYTAVGSGKTRGRPSRFWKQFIAVLLVGGIIFGYVAREKNDKLKYGFFGKAIPCSSSEREQGLCGACQWEGGTPWFDMLPVRQNIFTVSSSGLLGR